MGNGRMFTEVPSEHQEIYGQWAIERLRDEVHLFRETTKHFMLLVLIGNAAGAVTAGEFVSKGEAAAVTAGEIVSNGEAANELALWALMAFGFGLVSAIVFGLLVLAHTRHSHTRFRTGIIMYLGGEITDAEFDRDIARGTVWEKIMMIISSLSVLAFAIGVGVGLYGWLTLIS